jgi:hypothetical protein
VVKNSIDSLEDSFVSITKLSEQAVQVLDKWYSRQNYLVKIDIFKEQKNQFFKHTKLVENQEVVPLIAFYLAIKHYYDLERQQFKKNKSMSLKDLEKTTDFSVKQFKNPKAKVKKEKLLNLWSVVEKLKNEDFSFREISKYLKYKHRFEVSHTYIADVWKEIENGN